MFNFNLASNETKRINNIIRQGAAAAMTDKQFLAAEILAWKKSQRRLAMMTGHKYYDNEHDILDRKRTVIGQDGTLQEVNNLPNNKQIDNQYAKMVDQKVNYLLGKPLTFKTDVKAYEEVLKEVFNRRFYRLFKNSGEDALNGGISWIYPYLKDDQLKFKRFKGYEILPFWADDEHMELQLAIRLYEVNVYDGKKLKTIEKVEVYKVEGIEHYILKNGKLIEDVENPPTPYITIKENEEAKPYNWGVIPLVAFKYNDKETPLITRVKSLQDGINIMLSDFENNMQEDARNTILVIKNYSGTDLGEFRHNLAAYGAVKVKTVDGTAGGIDTLTVEVNADNYEAIIKLFKKALIENARGYDAKDDRMNGTPNQMNIQSMYSDIDLDANGMETEYQAAFESLLELVNIYLSGTNKGDYSKESVEVVFNRDVLINESETISNCKDSVGILSDETIIAQHPWISDVAEEQKRIKQQQDEYSTAFKVDEVVDDE